MKIHAVRWIDAVILAVVVAAIILFVAIAADQSLYDRDCGGYGFCRLYQAFQGYQVFGLNPFAMSLALVAGISFVPLLMRRLWTGHSAEVTDETLIIPGMFTTKRVRLERIAVVRIIPKVFNQVATVMFETSDGHRVGIGNACISDAKLLKEMVLNQPASSATPPAT